MDTQERTMIVDTSAELQLNYIITTDELYEILKYLNMKGRKVMVPMEQVPNRLLIKFHRQCQPSAVFTYSLLVGAVVRLDTSPAHVRI